MSITLPAIRKWAKRQLLQREEYDKKTYQWIQLQPRHGCIKTDLWNKDQGTNQEKPNPTDNAVNLSKLGSF